MQLHYRILSALASTADPCHSGGRCSNSQARDMKRRVKSHHDGGLRAPRHTHLPELRKTADVYSLQGSPVMRQHQPRTGTCGLSKKSPHTLCGCGRGCGIELRRRKRVLGSPIIPRRNVDCERCGCR